MAGTINLDLPAFRAQCPEFGSASLYPDITVTGYWEAATVTVSASDYGALNGLARARALNLMTAHLLKLADLIADGNAAGLVSAAGVDKINVTLVPPPVATQYRWWLSLTPYGAQLLALLQAKAAGGLYIGGRPERAAFRKGA